MKQFHYYRPKDIDEALHLLKQLPDVKILAGGTDLVIQLREGEVKPANVIDISALNELTEINITDTEINIGSMVTFNQIIEHPIIQKECNCLVEACTTIGSPQIRNQGTVGGNIANASPAADSVPPLVALGTKVILKSQQATEEYGIEEILAGVGQNNLAKNQLLTAIKVRRADGNPVSSFTKLARRNALAIARMSMAAIIRVDEMGNIKAAGISLGAVAPNPFRITEVEKYLSGSKLTPEIKDAAVDMIAQLVREKLGSRASAVYKNEAIKGVANNTFEKLMHQLRGQQK